MDPIPDPTNDSIIDLTSAAFADDYDINYGLLGPQQTVIVRAYSDDSDDQILAEIQPRFVVMFEPSEDFIRRIEVSITGDALINNNLFHRSSEAPAQDLGFACIIWCTRIVQRSTSCSLQCGEKRILSSG